MSINRSVLEVSVKDLSKTMFENKRSYDYFCKALGVMQVLQRLRESGAFLIHGNEPHTEDFVYRVDEDGTYPVLGTGKIGDKGITAWLGFTYGLKPDTVFVYKKELDLLKGFTYVEPQHVKKLNHL